MPALTGQPSEELLAPIDTDDGGGDESAQFSDAEDGPPTPSAGRSRTLEAEAASFALSGVVPADAWQTMCRVCGRELKSKWDETRGELVVSDAVMFHNVIYHAPCALTAMPPLPALRGPLV